MPVNLSNKCQALLYNRLKAARYNILLSMSNRVGLMTKQLSLSASNVLQWSLRISSSLHHF
ncbi:Uncharacterized protein APZ42_011632 [Daphnia magna]|uniref:Uncharacterized protein n=1 Tax=Daphnia magna TaxID=35525 RepID=A0A162SVF9_9CRUS|nr:Uncharacterized protein APZ42_011632 [Daphnia magna]